MRCTLKPPDETYPCIRYEDGDEFIQVLKDSYNLGPVYFGDNGGVLICWRWQTLVIYPGQWLVWFGNQYYAMNDDVFNKAFELKES